MSPETRGVPEEDRYRHIRLRTGAWLVDHEDQAEFVRFALKFGADRALVMVRDEDFVRHVRRTEALGIEPIDGTQWTAARQYAQEHQYDFDAVIRMTYRKLNKPLPGRDDEARADPPQPVQRPYTDDTSKPRTPDLFVMPPAPKPRRLAADPWAPGFDDPKPAVIVTPEPAAVAPAVVTEQRVGRTSEHPTKPLGPIVYTPAEKQATEWSADLGIPRHNLLRRSQTPVGRRERFLRAKAAEENITVTAAAVRHPARLRQEP